MNEPWQLMTLAAVHARKKHAKKDLGWGIIYEEASQANEAGLKKLEDVGAGDFAGYDFIFIGSPLHSGNLAAPVKDFLSNIQADSNQKMAGFITHFAPAYPDQSMDGFTEPIQAACKEKRIESKGCFDCQGALTESLHEVVKKKQNVSDVQWADMVKQMTGHPDQEDVAKAKAFAKKSPIVKNIIRLSLPLPGLPPGYANFESMKSSANHQYC